MQFFKVIFSDRPLKAMVFAILWFWCVMTLIPFAWLACGAFKHNEIFFQNLFLPLGEGFKGIAWEKLTLDNFRRLFFEVGIGNNLLNSFCLASWTSLLAAFSSALGGYAISKFRFRGQYMMNTLVISALIIPPPLLLAPNYQLLYKLGLLNTYSGLVLPAMAPAFGVFLFRQAMINSVPRELLESARVDGASELRIFLTIVLPLIKPMFSAFLLITFLRTWNNFIQPQVVLQDPDLYPLAVTISQLRGFYAVEYGIIAAGTLISILPVMVLFLILQKDFITGLLSGAVKG